MAKEEEVISKLREVVDPHTNINVYDMGLISELKVSKDSVSLTFRPTSPFCPLGVQLAHNIKRRVMSIKGVKKADVKVIGHVQEQMINRSLAEQ
ncbi:MAG TPA: iron-sulfur cluster assembly protein [Thermoplasmata archaeon]|jgi:metal-sulfur cluster biosynthetic enzyme